MLFQSNCGPIWDSVSKWIWLIFILCIQENVTQTESLSYTWLVEMTHTNKSHCIHCPGCSFWGVSTSFSAYIFTHLPLFQRRFVTHDAPRKRPSIIRNSTAMQATAAASKFRQPRHKIVATRLRNSEHRGAWLRMATGWPMARQSGYSKYTQGVQRHAHNVWVKAVSIVHTLPEVTSPQMASDARMLHENAKNCTLGAQNTYGNVMSGSGNRTCLMAVKRTVRCEIWCSDGVCLRNGTAGF